MLKSLKRHVPFNPPKKTYLHYPPRRSTAQAARIGRTAKVVDTLPGSVRQGCDDGAASAASAVNRFNAGGSVDRVLAPFNEVEDKSRGA